MKTLVTGGAGFIGSHIVDALLKLNHDVVVVDNYFSGREKNLADAKKTAKEKGLKLILIEGDVSAPNTWKTLSEIEAIFHTAAQTSVTASVTDADRDFAWNVVAAKNIVDYAREKEVRFLLYSNTAGALYGVPPTIPTDEIQPLHPICPYGATKSFLETYIRALTESLKMDGTWTNDAHDRNFFSWASLRLGNVYGPRQITKGEAGVVPIFIEKMFANESPTIFGTGKETRDYVHVADVVSAFINTFLRQQKEKVDQAYNVGTQVETSTREVFDVVRAAMGAHTKVAEPKFADLRAGELKQSCLEISKLKKCGWKPEWAFKKGVEQTVAHYLRNEKNIS